MARQETYLNQTGINSGETKNPANSICGTNRRGTISCASFGSSTEQPRIGEQSQKENTHKKVRKKNISTTHFNNPVDNVHEVHTK